MLCKFGQAKHDHLIVCANPMRDESEQVSATTNQQNVLSAGTSGWRQVPQDGIPMLAAGQLPRMQARLVYGKPKIQANGDVGLEGKPTYLGLDLLARLGWGM